MYQDPAREHGYHPTLDIFPTKKKGARVIIRYITRLEIWVNIHNSLQPSILQVYNHPTIAYRWYYKLKRMP